MHLWHESFALARYPIEIVYISWHEQATLVWDFNEVMYILWHLPVDFTWDLNEETYSLWNDPIAPVPLCLPQISHDLTQAQTRAAGD
jgi:hypothetical protein